MIAVLDAWPMGSQHASVRGRSYPAGLAALAAYRETHPGSDRNWRLTEAIDGALVAPERIHNHVRARRDADGDQRCVSYGCESFLESYYEMSSHGLFVADVAKDLAPSATLAVYRVMNAQGIGRMTDIAEAIEDAIAEAERACLKLVINASLGVGPPPWVANLILQDRDCFATDGGLGRLMQTIQTQRNRFGFTAEAAAATRAAGARTYHNLLTNDGIVQGTSFTGPLRVVEALLSVSGENDVLLVGAAGNDSCNHMRRFGPRLPAAFDGALAVSSFIPDPRTGRLIMTDYSNDDDCFPNNDGIGAFGGDVIPAQTPALRGGTPGAPARFPTTRRYPSVMGLFVADDYPALQPGGGEARNATGWARWSGTSFAAPVASGFAADLWSADETLTGRQVRDTIVYRYGRPPAEWAESLPFVQE